VIPDDGGDEILMAVMFEDGAYAKNADDPAMRGLPEVPSLLEADPSGPTASGSRSPSRWRSFADGS
jgi:hypothetical protein